MTKYKKTGVPSQHQKPMFNGIAFDEDYLYTVEKNQDKKFEYVKVANYVGIEQSRINIEDNSHLVRLSYKSILGGNHLTLDTTSCTLTSTSRIETLSQQGVDVNSANKMIILKHLRNCMDDIEPSYVHTGLGFINYSGEYVFRHENLIGTDNHSSYDGKFEIKPRGSLEDWLEMVKQHVIGQTPLEAMIILGLSAATLAYYGSKLSIETQIVHIRGDSSTGKSTALQLFVSTFGSPEVSKDGLVLTWNTTTNALLESISNNFGVPIGIDELSMIGNQDLTSLLYSLSSSKGKSRLSQDSKVMDAAKWHTILASNGEVSIIDMAANNTGLRARVSEFDNINWTKSADHSNVIKAGCIANYGQVGPIFVEALLKEDEKKFLNYYDSWRQKLILKLDKSVLRDRLAQKISLYLVTAELARKYLDLDFNIDELCNFLVSAENNRVDDINLGLKARDYVKSIVASNQNNFIKSCDGKTAQHKAGECWGILYFRYNKKKEKEELYKIAFNAEKLEEKISEHQRFQSLNIIVNSWRKNGWLESDSDRITKRITSNGNRSKYYVINV